LQKLERFDKLKVPHLVAKVAEVTADPPAARFPGQADRHGTARKQVGYR
jgi:hypothetical protein